MGIKKFIQNTTTKIKVIKDITNHIPHANLFCLAQTYSFLCFLTKKFANIENSEYLGPIDILIQKSINKTGTRILKSIKSIVTIV